MRPSAVGSWMLLLSAVVVLGRPAGTHGAQSGGAGGSRESRWGPMPAEADSVRARFDDPGRKAWEWPLYVPWKAASVPFDVVNHSLRYAYLGLDRSGAIYHVRRLFRPVDLPYGFSLSGVAGSLVGFGVGLNLYHDELFGAGNRFQTKFSASSRGHKQASLGYVRERGERGYLELGGGYRKRTNARFFGLGAVTTESDRSFFTQEASWAGATLHQRVVGDLAAEVTALFTTMENRGPERSEDEPSIESAFEDELPFGYGFRSDGWQLTATLEHDDTRTEGRPRNGGSRRLAVSYFAPRGDREVGFAQYRGELQQFLPLWYDRALALRGYTSWVGLPADQVHFQRLMTNDDPDVFRGYDDFRFRDRGILGLTVEYRYPVWAYKFKHATGIDAYAFFDWAQVYDDRQDIGLRNLTESYGLGFRIVSHRGFSARAEVGFSEEDTVFRLRTDQVFQFHKRGFYHGRTPVPAR